jgi:thiol:disulfide interchange protein/DsbC/DsbD-like thiol-disulfide interchange protein
MAMIVFRCLVLFLVIFNSSNVFAQNYEKHVDMQVKVFESNDKSLIAITLKNDQKWHTYWKNPGDAGLAITFDFNLNDKPFAPKEYEWPTPHRYREDGDVIAYGYGGDYTFFFETNKDDISNGELLIHGKWLVCKQICLPGEQTVEVSLDQSGEGETSNHQIDENELLKRLAKLPQLSKKPENLEIYFTKGEGETLYLQYTLKDIELEDYDFSGNILYPFLTDPLDFKHEKVYWDNNNKTLYGVIPIDWDGQYEEPEWPLPEDGVFTRKIIAPFLFIGKDHKTIKFELPIKEFSPTGYASFNNFLKSLTPLDENSMPTQVQEGPQNIFYYILFAFLGGLILNLMPCVLPVISLKLFGLIAHRDESKSKILKHNLSYTLGVIVTFIVLAIVVLSLKISGEQVGWGFQLQSPGFVFFMLMMIFIMSLNLLGLFEFITPGGKTLGTKEIKRGFSADFVNGVLATILSTPCSAPFLGAALTFAFTTSYFNIFLIFIFVGIGLSFPFIITGFFPKLISFLPKPGKWMDHLKKVLGLTMLLTTVWLYDVLANIINYSNAGIYLNTIIVLTFFAFFFRKHIARIFAWNVIVFALPIIFTSLMIQNNGLEVYYADEASVKTEESNLDWMKWDEQEMKSYQDQWVFVDFTAKWCLTCKVNKKLVLNTKGFEELVQKYDIQLMVADWTKRDDNITQFLRKYNIVGVPAYFIQKPDGELISLGEVISIEKITKHIKGDVSPSE